jgi:deferrochelatase/peroxidase EfeB
VSWADVQALLLRPSTAKSVAHLMLRVAPGRGGEALETLKALRQAAPLTLGAELPAAGIHCSWGFTYRGLEALGMPSAYLRVFARLAPAFKQGAQARAAQLGDTGPSASSGWDDAFTLDRTHVVLTWHGEREPIDQLVQEWTDYLRPDAALVLVTALHGDRLGAPRDRVGEWVHFGFRDGLVEHRIAGVERAHQPSSEVEVVQHAAGEFLLGYANDQGANAFGLPLAPAEWREFFHDSSFGVLRKMEQDVPLFEAAVQGWLQSAQAAAGPQVTSDWVKAKLCGRWPTGQVIRPGQLAPPSPGSDADFRLDFEQDAQATGCPWSAHVRRMDARGHAGGVGRQRSLLRRGMPYGPAYWDGEQAVPRGILGLFFCASLEDQFELLLGQWANGSPPGRPARDAAADPLAGRHGDADAAALVPLPGGQALRLAGFGAWTRTLGSTYTWHPRHAALARILVQEYAKKDEAPWL